MLQKDTVGLVVRPKGFYESPVTEGLRNHGPWNILESLAHYRSRAARAKTQTKIGLHESAQCHETRNPAQWHP